MPILLFIFPTFALCEYRAYEYIVVNKIPDNETKNVKKIKSSLNPKTYVAYYGGEHIIKIKLLRSWICPGNTSFKEVCNSPYEDYLINGKKESPIPNKEAL